jgi:hypothetical protein
MNFPPTGLDNGTTLHIYYGHGGVYLQLTVSERYFVLDMKDLDC